MPDELLQVQRSAWWAAYGDALGFITELTTSEGEVRRRYGNGVVTSLGPWRRRIGGRLGVVVELPAGCYSDDTQLRLATSRSIRGDGHFDVAAFAKIELPVWPAYGLGGGRGTKTAASNLARSSATWSTNFFEGDSRYLTAGGNGAAMRVQPHVWSAARDDETFGLSDVIRNAVTTHGHPRGILGAAYHAVLLGFALRDASIPGPDQWEAAVETLRGVPDLLRSDEELSLVWVPLWEASSGTKVVEGFEEIRQEMRDAVRVARTFADGTVDASYPALLHELGCMDVAERGSGTKTAVAAGSLAWLGRQEPLKALEVAVNVLGSDTDSIATMAGALIGADRRVEELPPAVLDQRYILRDAGRLERISSGSEGATFEYPDLLRWKAPRSQLDAVGDFSGALAVAGLGEASAIEEPVIRDGDAHGWQWMTLRFGQTLIAKRRIRLRKMGSEQLAPQRADSETVRQKSSPPTLFEPTGRRPTAWSQRPIPHTIEDAMEVVVRSDFDAAVVGELVLHFCSRGEADKAVALTGAVAYALSADRRRRRG